MSASKPCVLAAVDLEGSTGAVLETAIREASRRPNGALVVLFAIDLSAADVLEEHRRASTNAALSELTARTRKALQKFAEENPGAPLPPAEVNVTLGRPAREIVWAAAHFDAEAVVVGSHGRKGLGRFFMGSVAERVVRLAGCPVLVVRAKNHDPRIVLPEIEPVCPECAEARAASNGAKLWCARHAEHHVRAHVYSSAGRTESPSAWSSSTGT